MVIPFYLEYSDFVAWTSANFPNLVIGDSIMFLSYIITNIAFIFLILILIKIFIKVLLFFKNIIFR